MSRILITTVPVSGHLNPLLPIARRLVERGHEVRWYTHERFRSRVEATGATLIAAAQSCGYDDSNLASSFPEREKLSGVSQLKFDIKHVFIDDAPGQVRELKAITRNFVPALILADAGFLGAMLFKETSGIPVVTLGVLPMTYGGDDVAPFGLGIAPSGTWLGRIRNRALHWLVRRVLFADVQKHWNKTRAELGLPIGGWVLDAAIQSTLYLQPTIQGFEYPRRKLPATVRFIGAMPIDPPHNWVAPDWWHELDGDRPVVHVTQGTIANERPLLFAPALEALEHEDVLVVLSTGGRSPESLGLSRLPRNARIGTFLSYPSLLPRTAVMLTNGGYGGVQAALSQAVPVIVAGDTEDKPEVAARVAWSGAGINLKTAKPTAAAIRAAVRAILGDTRYRDRARALADEHARHDAISQATALVEEVAAMG